MTTALAIYEARKVELSYLQSVGQVLADTHFFKDATTAEKAVATILAGQEFGLGPLEAMRSFHVIDGKVEMSADAQARLVKASEKYDYRVVEIDDDHCKIEFSENGKKLGWSVFSMDDAERAKVIKVDSAWEKYPRNMLFARAMTNGIAWFCPDAIAGGRVYAPGEIGGQAWEQPLELEPVATDANTHDLARDGMGAERGSDDEGAPAPEPSDPSREEPGDETLAYGEGASGPEPGSSPDPEASEGDQSRPASVDVSEGESGQQDAGESTAAPAPAPPESTNEQATADYHHKGRKHRMRESTTSPGARYCDLKGCDFIAWPKKGVA